MSIDLAAEDAPTSHFISEMDRYCLSEALEAAKQGLSEGGIPIGSVLYHHPTRKIISTGWNQRVQKGSMTLHAEMDCYEKLGRPSKEMGGLKALRECTLFTTLSPCIMCTGTSLLYRLPRIILGENTNFLSPGEALLKSHGVIVINADDEACKEMMGKWVEEDGKRADGGVWREDIGKLS